MKRILITGGAGMLGSNLTEALLRDGNYVISIDNLFTGKKHNIDHFIDNKNYRFIFHDVRDSFSDIHADEIYHLAAPASPVKYCPDAVFTAQTILIGTMNALECAEKNHARILLASTSEVYGQPLEHPQKETYNGNVHTTYLRAAYNESKRCAETLAAIYAEQHCVDIAIARIFNTYGPYMSPDDGRVISEFIVNTLKQKTITINGNGEQTRAFCYVSDMVNGLMRLMASNIHSPINLGNPCEITLLTLLSCVESCLGMKANVVHGDIANGDPLKRCPSIELAKELLNWEPLVSLDIGLKLTAEYFRKCLDTM